MKRHSRSVLALCVSLCTLAAAPPAPDPAGPLVVGPGGSPGLQRFTGEAIQEAVDKAHAQGGGVVVLKRGSYVLRSPIDLSNKTGVTLLGEPGAVLQAQAQQQGVLAQAVEAGAKALVLEAAMDLPAGARIEIHSQGRRVVTPKGDVYHVPYIMGHVARSEGTRLTLSRPIRYAAAKGAKIISVFNGIIVRGKAKNITIQNVTLDMNRDAWPVAPKNHTYHCALIAGGPYSYEKGPTGPPVEGLRIVGCKIQNAHHRGIAFYSVIHSGVYSCHIENTAAEGIDFDHFAYHCEAVGNTVVRCRNIELNDASHCLISHNRVVSPGVGVVVWQWCKLPGLNEHNLILHNEIVDSRGDGISLGQGADFNTVAGNVVRNSAGVGISVQGRGNRVVGNRVSGSRQQDLKVTGQDNLAMDNAGAGQAPSPTEGATKR